MKVILLALVAVMSMSTNALSQNGKRVLVAYFSATGTTEAAAGKLAKATGGTLYEIEPERAYTSADLDWHNSNSRSSVEMKDAGARPAIKGKKVDMAQYDTVYLGYPIWWNMAPRAVNTFIESVELSGKTVVLFATSGGSSIDGSVEAIRKSYPDVKFVKGRLLNGMTESAIGAWVKELSNR